MAPTSRIASQTCICSRSIPISLWMVAMGLAPLLGHRSPWHYEWSRTSASGVKQPANVVQLREPIVERHCGPGLRDVYRDTTLTEKIQGFRAGLQDQVHPATQHDHRALALEQLRDVRRLNARDVSCAGLVPVPRATAARVQLEVLAGSEPVNLHTAPGDMGDPGRASVVQSHPMLSAGGQACPCIRAS